MLTEPKEESKGENKYDLSAHYAKIYSDIFYQGFSQNCNIFDIDEFVAEEIPDNIEGYSAVIVDIHY